MSITHVAFQHKAGELRTEISDRGPIQLLAVLGLAMLWVACFLSVVLNAGLLPAFKTQGISHKSPDFWLILKIGGSSNN